jgi:hypothetical protein
LLKTLTLLPNRVCALTEMAEAPPRLELHTLQLLPTRAQLINDTPLPNRIMFLTLTAEPNLMASKAENWAPTRN